MKKVTIHESQKEALLGKIRQVFQRKARPDTTPIHYRKIQVKRED